MNAKKKSLLKKKWIHLKWIVRYKLRFLKNNRFFKYVKRNKKWLVFLPSVSLGVQLWNQQAQTEKWRTRAEDLMVENTHLTRANIGRNLEMDDFDRAWFEKTYILNDSIRITGMNRSYEDIFKVNRIKSLGRSNFELFPKEAAVIYEKIDRFVLDSATAKNAIEPWIENDTIKMLLFTHKWPSKYVKDRIYGVVIPLDEIIAAIDEYELEK